MSHSSPSFLKQRYLNERREFYLEKERIRVYQKDANGEVELFVRYEELGKETRRISKRDGRLYNITISFALFALVGFVAYLLGYPLLMRWAPLWAIAAIIFFGFYLWRRRNYFLLRLENGNFLFFLANNPSADALQGFLKEMEEARNRYFRHTYFQIINPDHPDHELARFEQLLRMGIISQPEFEDMKAQLLGEDAEPSDGH